ncbi:hypothetical protein LTR37_005639 [Vermiconidia calcicola]|uniref:Uncharacterized protein n=1 Tax=Vermiconidia calcicola TaxID=1690605 RepID=A0ACC3NJ27_9PEZI|nr:hypothetical protein LTR37_005639 [Vermiconidia calcicola]
MANPTSVEFELPTGVSTFKPEKHFRLDDKFIHYMATAKSKLSVIGQDFKPTKAETKLMLRTGVKKIQGLVGHTPFAEITSTSFLMRRNHDEDADRESERYITELNQTDTSVLLWVYTGNGKPKVDDVAKYTRMYLNPTDEGKTQWRWTKCEPHPNWETSPGKETFEKMSHEFSILEESLRDDFRLAHVCIGYDHKETTLQEMLYQSGDCANNRLANYANMAVNALLAKDTETAPTAKNQDSTALHGHKQYTFDVKSSKSFAGLRLCRGTARTLWLTPQIENGVVLSQQYCYKLFFPTASVADLLNTHTAAGGRYDDVADALRGVKVRIRNVRGQEDRFVYKLGETPATASVQAKHQAWLAKVDSHLRFPEMPCVNVGKPGRNELIPAEMCSILPMQSFGSGASLQYQLEFASLKQFMNSTPPGDRGKEQNLLVHAPYQKVDVGTGKDKFKVSFPNGGPNVLFVEAGVEKRFSGSWTELCRELSKNAAYSLFDDAPTSVPPLFLMYKPGGDPVNIWQDQIAKFVHKHEQDGKKTLLVVAVQADQHHKKLYELIKTICDTKIGAQTFFVNMATLEQKARAAPADGAIKAANEITKRMRIRNPPDESTRSDKIHDIAVGLHMTPVTGDLENVDENGKLSCTQQELFLVVTVSRHRKRAEGYRTERNLLTAEELETFNPTKYVLPHLSRWSTESGNASGEHRVTIFRSGRLPVTKADNTVSRGNRIARKINDRSPFTLNDRGLCRGSITKSEVFEAKAQRYTADFNTDQRANEVPPEASKARSANDEVAMLKEGIQKEKKSRFQLCYILLDEENAFQFFGSAKELIANAIKSNTNDSSSASFFLRSSSIVNRNSFTVKAHRRMTPKSNSKLISLTLLGDKARSTKAAVAGEPEEGSTDALSTPTSPDSSSIVMTDGAADIPPHMRRGLAPISPRHKSEFHAARKSKASGGSLNLPKASGDKGRRGDRTDSERQAIKPDADATQDSTLQLDITDAELEELALLFRDDHLELYDTKWPIPTYLAQLAAKRTKMHLRNDPKLPDDVFRTNKLPGIPKGVQESLYYL